jgi:oligoendopeptidase F
MFVYSLYERYLREGKTFAPKLAAALSKGSSKSPQEIGKAMGLDVSSLDFWKGGLDVFERFVRELENLT